MDTCDPNTYLEIYMQKTVKFFTGICLALTPMCLAFAGQKLPILSNVTFYDGYASRVDAPTAEGVIRHRNDLYAVKLSDNTLSTIGTDLQLNITIRAACDNYDRIGNFNLVFVPKGSASYSPESAQRIEVGRFITPFMNKNNKPDQLSYRFQVNNLAPILSNPQLRAVYDFWAELELFGVPYAAQNEVPGCSGRNDVFVGSAEFETSGNPPAVGSPLLIPLNFKKNLNNYADGASDQPGQTVRTISFRLSRPLANAHFYLITSNHGSNAGGEEYKRRAHFVYFDSKLLGSYTPGGESCEPYRVYNTQANGIYGWRPKSPAEWASFSNWCPGQVIPIRHFALGDLSAGEHSFRLAVPDAVFAGRQGDIPVSLYLQGSGI